MSEKTFKAIKQLLDKHNVSYAVMEHEPVHTSEEAAKVRGYGIKEGMKRGAKAMIMRSSGKFYQFIVPGDKKIDMKKARKALSATSFSLASPEEVKKLSDCVIGSVPPFGNLWDIPVYADKHLNATLDFSAGLHEVSMTMSLADWKKIVKPVMGDFSR